MPYMPTPLQAFIATYRDQPIKAPPLKGVRRLNDARMDGHVIVAETALFEGHYEPRNVMELPCEWGIHPVCSTDNFTCFGR